jgi:hypothetical protein
VITAKRLLARVELGEARNLEEYSALKNYEMV